MMNFSFLQTSYNREAWKSFIRHVFPNESDLFAAPQTFPELHGERIQSFVQFGNIHLQDRFGSQLALFEVMLKPETTKLQINRVALRQIIEKLRRDTLVTGAFAVFADPATGKWRFTFIAKQEIFGEKIIETADPRRFTYVFGPGETTRTAEQRFTFLAGKSGKELGDVLEAFSVEKIGDEFFKKYKSHYETLCQHLYKKPEAAQIFKADTPAAAQKLMRDFAKKLMGRLVFLYFLQKKGWLGAPANETDWKRGDSDFVRNLFEKSPDRARFHSRELALLFFKTINERRAGDLFEMPDGSKTRVPYLNGGLFDDDLPEGNVLDFPETWFAEVFEFFSQYNFTIDENSPHDHEVGIDPEMLGSIFENLLEDNKDKGAFYTPKEIVHYMCHESLLEYLKTALGQPTGDDLAALETFVRDKKRGEPDNFIHRQVEKIKNALLDVRICDPAIGSGAFPMGLLHEIFQCQVELDPDLDPAALKKNIIHHCIYGVDKDKGAVDIARLRFWLSLVVDEDEPQELPNLDFKIMQGDSLLERFEGIDLSRIAQTETSLQVRVVELFSEQEAITEIKPDAETLVALLDEYFAPEEAAQKHRKKPRPKAQIHAEIDRQVLRHIEYNLEVHEIQLTNRLAEAKKDLEKLVAAVQSPDQKTKLRTDSRAAQKVADLEAQTLLSNARFERLKTMQGREERPFFLWHLYFRDVFERGGFDIVIGNPPYVQLQKMGKQSETLGAAGYSTFVKTGDLYCLFYERALQILRPGGIMAFITSNSWLKTRYGEPLRKLFTTEADPLQLLNFEDSQIFKAAIVETNILLAQKSKFSDRLRAVAIGPETPVIPAEDLSKAGKPFHQLLLEKGNTVGGLSHEAWSIGDTRTQRIKLRIEEGARLLKNFDIEIFRGVLTGLNEAFILSEDLKNELVAAEPKCTEILKPLLRGRDVQRFASTFSNLWLLYVNSSIGENDYPAVTQFLKNYKEKLEARRGGMNPKTGEVPYEWWQLQVDYYSSGTYLNFEKPKIIWAEISDSQKFVFDDQGFFTNNKCFLMVGEKLKFMLAILNSKVCNWFFNLESTTTGMGTTMWAKYKIENLPIREASPEVEQHMEQLVDYILWQKRQPASAAGQQRSDYLEQVLDGLVFELYFGEEMRQAGRSVAEHLGALPPLAAGQEEKTVEAVFGRLFGKTHPVRVNLFHLRSIEEIGFILEATKPKKGNPEKLTDHAPADNED